MVRVKLLCIGLLHKATFKQESSLLPAGLGKSEEGMTMHLKIDGSSPTVGKSFLLCIFLLSKHSSQLDRAHANDIKHAIHPR